MSKYIPSKYYAECKVAAGIMHNLRYTLKHMEGECFALDALQDVYEVRGETVKYLSALMVRRAITVAYKEEENHSNNDCKIYKIIKSTIANIDDAENDKAIFFDSDAMQISKPSPAKVFEVLAYLYDVFDYGINSCTLDPATEDVCPFLQSDEFMNVMRSENTCFSKVVALREQAYKAYTDYEAGHSEL